MKEMGHMKIGAYRFGEIVIDGICHTKDLKIIRGKIFENWWRSQGHTLQLSDILDVVEAKPSILIIGTGAYGRMVLSSGLSAELDSRGIRIEALPTEPAIQRFNELASQLGQEAVAFAVHLTC
ncbi:MAG: hypothetical protein EHM49_07000 [Deltaproteobacteria bacterium]|nr:MAG: hypothetical protein EHM49_07000 [Deltaproteobacteria bacterium]